MITFKELVSQITVSSSRVENNIDMDNWNKFEEQTNVELPSDYIKFINFYGTGRLSQLLWILNPFSANDRFNVLMFLEGQRRAFGRLKKEYDVTYPYKLFENGSGILPFGFTDNGDSIYWNIKQDKNESYSTVILDGRNANSEEHHITFSELLDKILNRKLDSLIINMEDVIDKVFSPLDKNVFKI